MPRRIQRHSGAGGDWAASNPYRFSQPLVSEMVAFLSKRLGREVSMVEADEALGRLTDFYRILSSHKRDFQ
jgi:hypothetical protein